MYVLENYTNKNNPKPLKCFVSVAKISVPMEHQICRFTIKTKNSDCLSVEIWNQVVQI